MEQPIEQLQAQIAFLENEKDLNESQIVVLNQKLKKAFLQENITNADFFNQQHQVKDCLQISRKLQERICYFAVRILDCEHEIAAVKELN